MAECDIYARRAVVAECERGLSLMLQDGKGCRDLLRLARTRRRDVTRGDGIGLLAGGPRRAVRGAWFVQLCGSKCAVFKRAGTLCGE